MYAKSLQLYLTVYDPMDGSLPGSSVRGIPQARILEQVTIPFSRRYQESLLSQSLSLCTASFKGCRKHLGHRDAGIKAFVSAPIHLDPLRGGTFTAYLVAGGSLFLSTLALG